MAIDIDDSSGVTWVNTALIGAQAAYLLDRLHLDPDVDVSILLVDEEEMARLHVEWMDEPGPTDVLSFPMDDLRAGERVAVDYLDPYAYEEAGVHGETHMKAPMPGRVVALLAEAGARVAKGEPLLILEAMKMEHTITAPADGKVLAFYFAAGEQVSDGDELVDFEAD